MYIIDINDNNIIYIGMYCVLVLYLTIKGPLEVCLVSQKLLPLGLKIHYYQMLFVLSGCFNSCFVY